MPNPCLSVCASLTYWQSPGKQAVDPEQAALSQDSSPGVGLGVLQRVTRQGEPQQLLLGCSGPALFPLAIAHLQVRAGGKEKGQV